MKKPSHTERVNALFDQLQHISLAEHLPSSWLADLRSKACKRERGWKRDIKSYLHGWAASGYLLAGQIDEFYKLIDACYETELSGRELVVPIAWTLCIAAWAFGTKSIGMSPWLAAPGAALTAGVGIFWANQKQWLLETQGKPHPRWMSAALGAFVGCGTVVIACLLPYFVGVIAQTYSVRQFNTDRDAFMKDPAGFPMIQAFARTNFDIDVVLGDDGDSWASTTLSLPGSSPASMETGPGFCELRISREGLLRDFAPVHKRNAKLWVQGVMLHELAHCLDISRDFPAFGIHRVQTHAIAPLDRAGIIDIESYLTAKRKPSTKMWREALADIFMVGYWRMAYPSEARALIEELTEKRNANKTSDKVHATMCWIGHASRANLPPNESALLQWADRERSATDCPVT
jgi:hypothetical protein